MATSTRGSRQQTLLDNARLTDTAGVRLENPHLCQALEEHSSHTQGELHRGHVEKGHRAFADRERDFPGFV